MSGRKEEQEISRCVGFGWVPQHLNPHPEKRRVRHLRVSDFFKSLRFKVREGLCERCGWWG